MWGLYFPWAMWVRLSTPSQGEKHQGNVCALIVLDGASHAGGHCWSTYCCLCLSACLCTLVPICFVQSTCCRHAHAQQTDAGFFFLNKFLIIYTFFILLSCWLLLFSSWWGMRLLSDSLPGVQILFTQHLRWPHTDAHTDRATWMFPPAPLWADET